MAMQKRVLVIQNADEEGMGTISSVLRSQGVGWTVIRSESLKKGDFCKLISSFDGLIVLGGYQSVYDDTRFPYLFLVRELIREAILGDRPVLGICLGSQLLAKELGGDVIKNDEFEIGWKEVWINKSGENDPLFGAIYPSAMVFHWHGDIFTVPPGATVLASSDVTKVQAFVWGEKHYGVLFHMEVDIDQISLMIRSFDSDVRRGGENPDELESRSRGLLGQLTKRGNEFFSNWCRLLN